MVKPARLSVGDYSVRSPIVAFRSPGVHASKLCSDIFDTKRYFYQRQYLFMKRYGPLDYESIISDTFAGRNR